MQLDNNLNERLQARLVKRQEEGSLRTLQVNHTERIDFCSNDYLGLARNAALAYLIKERTSQIRGNYNGAAGSRLISGNSLLAEDLERQLALLFNSEASLVFNSGYAANLAILSAVPSAHDTIIYDELAHACIKDGARLSLAKKYSFKHNDLGDLKRKLQLAQGQKFVVLESVYSMDGDFCSVELVRELAHQSDVHLIIDEAHSTGVYGVNGKGWVIEQGLQDAFFARIYTFGKAMGVHGACVVGSDVLRSYLINFSRPFIYTTAMSPHSLISIAESFRYLAQHTDLQSSLHELIQHFNSQINAQSWGDFYWIQSHSAIQALVIPGNDQVKKIAHELQEAGFDVRPILSPTVKLGQERLRICLHAFNTHDEVDWLLQMLHQQMDELMASN